MENNVVLVKLWGEVVGYVRWDSGLRVAVFEYDPAFVKSGLEIAPLTMPLSSARSQRGLPWTGDRDKLYQGLPPMLADSLPDAWGDRVLRSWLTRQQIPLSRITPVDKLLFIGSRGMGALEYEPAHRLGIENFPVDVQELYRFARSILAEREEASLPADRELLWQDLVKIGTSAGGKRPKALVALNPATGEIRSGQTEAAPGFTHYILKLDEGSGYPSAKIEYVYSRMAQMAGLRVMPGELIERGGTFHFLTPRFDRDGNRKIHTQTAAAIRPGMESYEELFGSLGRLGVPYPDVEQLFRLMVFNVLSRNVDDHTKNFSFCLIDGRWRLAPAYDLTFSVDLSAPGYVNGQSLTVNGKARDIGIEDFKRVAAEQGIAGAGRIVEQVAEAIGAFPRLAREIEVPDRYSEAIGTALQGAQEQKTLAVPPIRTKTDRGI